MKKSLLRLSVAAIALTAAVPAFAQSAPAPAEAPEPEAVATVDEVVVTGSRIRRVDLEGVAPVSVLTGEAIDTRGFRSVFDALSQATQNTGSVQGEDFGATFTPAANVISLRGLGPNHTLVLLNGRRVAEYPSAYNGSVNAVNLANLPNAVVDRIEVLTGGAGAIYGSDAVAGVVNFIMDDKFQGIQIDSNYQFYNHDQNGGPAADAATRRNFALPGDKGADGKVKDITLTMGGNFADGKGNAVVFFGYKKEDALLQSERDFTACSLGGSTVGDTFNCGGSGTSYPGRFLLGSQGFTVADAAGGVRPYNAATDAYNFGPLNYFRRPSERYTFSSFTHYDINDKARLYAEASFHDDSTVAQIAPSGLFGIDASGANAIRYENPLLSDAWRQTLGLNAPGDSADMVIFRRNVEGGGRRDDLNHTSYRGVVGVKGDIGNWQYDAFAQVGKVKYSETYFNDFSVSRSARALDVITGANGQPVCRSTTNGVDPSCVPYDIWRLGGVSQEALTYLQTPGFQKGTTSQTVQGVNLSTDLGEYGLKIPTSNEGIGLALGWEHRTEKLDLNSDVAFESGDLAGQGGPTKNVSGQFSVRDYYAETRIPLLQKQPFADQLTATASYRKSDYSTGQKTSSYGAGLEWAPIQQAKFRFSYQRAARAANVVELFTPAGLSLYGMAEDPCSGANPTASLEACARTGVTAAQYGTILDSPAQQYNQISGGNNALAPEESDSYTLGLVLTPTRNSSITIDAFDMKVKGIIGGLPASTTLDQCMATGDETYCSLITRDRLGTLWALETAQIVATNQNLGMASTKGIDLGANYNTKLGAWGSLNLSLMGTYLKEFKQQDMPGTDPYDCAGLHGTTCGVPLPKWRHKLRAVWGTPWSGVELGATWRYVRGTSLDTESEPADARLGARNYLDLVANWQISPIFTLRAGMNNALDKDPPLSGVVAEVFGNGNTYPQVYDAMGRHIFLNLTAKF